MNESSHLSNDAAAGVPAELAARLPGFADLGIDPALLMQAVRSAGPEKGPATPGWPRAMMVHAERAMTQGAAAESAGQAAAAERAFLDASFWYFFARFPHIFNEGGAIAYRLHNEAYRRAGRFFEFPIETVHIPFEDKPFAALLRLPKAGRAKFPLVLVSGGIDVWKSDLEIHHLSNLLLSRGMATLAIDMPGTGECPIPAAAGAESVYLAALAHLKKDPRFDAERLGVYGLSFGGHFATKLALIDPGLAGVVQVGGPVHLTFQPENLARLPLGLKMALGRILGLQPSGDIGADSTRRAGRLAALSLKAQGLLPAGAHAPLLSIDGDDDELVPIADLHLLSTHGVQQDRLTFARDRHVASGNARLHRAFAASWLSTRLNAQRRDDPQF